MASKSAYQSQEKGAEIEEALDDLEKLLERVRVMYEQYFLGIAKMAPQHLHTDCERKIRDVTQIQIKNTALRYRFATLSQKFGAYNSYWKRTLRMIEQGKYVRDLQRIKRKSERSGEDIPEEILAAMPKLMRERVMRDRAMAIKIAEREGKLDGLVDDTGAPAARPAAAGRQPGNIHRLDDALVPDDVNVDDLFATLTREAEEAIDAAPRVATRRPARESVAPVIHSGPPPREDFDPPTEPGGPPAEAIAELPRKKSLPTTPPMRPPPMRGAVPPPPPPRQAPSTPTIALPPPVPRPVPAAPSRPVPPSSARSSPAARPGSESRSSLGPPPGMTDDDTRTLYNRYLKARELCGESNDGVTYDKLVRTLRSQSSKIMTDHKAKGVEFGVVIKDNKVVLKAKPKI